MAPNRKVHSRKSPPVPFVTLAVVTYCGPEAWYKNRTEIMKMCLDTMLEGIKEHKYELIIWDNGSTPEYRDFLQSYNPDVFVKSINVGGYNARRAMLGIARGEYTCITDDDVLFSSHWLSEQLKILHAFPPAATVSGCVKNYNAGAGELVRLPGCSVRIGQMMPREWFEALCASVGQSPGGSDRGEEMLAERNGVKAWVIRADTQLLGKTTVLQDLHKPYCEYLGTSGHLCDRIKDSGMIQMATLQRTSVHIGNQIDKTVNAAYKQMTGPNPLPVLDLSKASWVFRND